MATATRTTPHLPTAARTVAVMGLAVLVVGGCGQSPSKTPAASAASPPAAMTPSPTTADTTQPEQVRVATAKFADIATANSAGYTVWAPDPKAPKASCPSSAAGKMGYHLVNPALRGAPPKAATADATIDAAQPEQLLYAKKADGSLQLVGVEYLVFKAAWEREHGVGAQPPAVLGRSVPASKHSFTSGGPEIEHYELHVWLHADNPSGMFSAYHPGISC